MSSVSALSQPYLWGIKQYSKIVEISQEKDSLHRRVSNLAWQTLKALVVGTVAIAAGVIPYLCTRICTQGSLRPKKTCHIIRPKYGGFDKKYLHQIARAFEKAKNPSTCRFYDYNSKYDRTTQKGIIEITSSESGDPITMDKFLSADKIVFVLSFNEGRVHSDFHPLEGPYGGWPMESLQEKQCYTIAVRKTNDRFFCSFVKIVQSCLGLAPDPSPLWPYCFSDRGPATHPIQAVDKFFVQQQVSRFLKVA